MSKKKKQVLLLHVYDFTVSADAGRPLTLVSPLRAIETECASGTDCPIGPILGQAALSGQPLSQCSTHYEVKPIAPIGPPPKDIKDLLIEHCKKWVFQLESGKDGYQHYQGRLSMKIKCRINGVIKKFPGWHISTTSTKNKDNDFYVTKSDSRLSGPWRDTDVDVFIPIQISNLKLYPWQEMIINDANIFDTRKINVVFDPVGGKGKSTLCTYIGVHGIGRKLPYSNDFRDIMRMVMCTPTSKLYIIDMPKAISKDRLYQFFSGIEEIKNGYAYDDRYKFKEKFFNCPNIWLFTNSIPAQSMLTNDRWVYWNFDKSGMNLKPMKFFNTTL